MTQNYTTLNYYLSNISLCGPNGHVFLYSNMFGARFGNVPDDMPCSCGQIRYKDNTNSRDEIRQALQSLVEFTWTPAAGETLDLMVRRDSDTDTWSVVCAESTAANANTIKLIERSGGDTERSSAAQTFTAGNSYRIVIIVYGTTIKTYVSNTAKNSYSSASHNQTSTGVKASGFTTGSHLVAWPRTLSGAAKAALDEVANA